jgi:hypothetical protein
LEKVWIYSFETLMIIFHQLTWALWGNICSVLGFKIGSMIGSFNNSGLEKVKVEIEVTYLFIICCFKWWYIWLWNEDSKPH